MAKLRRYCYFVFVALWTGTLGLIFWPLYLVGGQYATYKLSKWWCMGLQVGLRLIVGLSYRITGRDNLGQPPYVVAIKHQSMFETLLLTIEFYNPCIVLKKEILAIPIFGDFFRATEHISVDRDNGSAAMMAMMKRMKKVLEKKRVLVIFPEGTRGPVGKVGNYQAGVYMMSRLGVPVYPVALNTGCFWTKKKFNRGVAELAILPAMPSGLGKEEFLSLLAEKIETKTRELEAKAYPKA